MTPSGLRERRMEARHSPSRWSRIGLALLATLLATGLWQAYGYWLFDKVRTHVA
jgi:hypothetical protein